MPQLGDLSSSTRFTGLELHCELRDQARAVPSSKVDPFVKPCFQSGSLLLGLVLLRLDLLYQVFILGLVSSGNFVDPGLENFVLEDLRRLL